jgi:hypothetical protein
MAAVAQTQASGADGDWKNNLQLPAKDLRYKTEVSITDVLGDRWELVPAAAEAAGTAFMKIILIASNLPAH